MAGVRERIETRLREALAPVALEVRDDSEQHRGHGGWREGGETHFHVTLVTFAFEGLSRVERHRLVNGLLAEELAGRVHALSLRLLTPRENMARD
ncbi:MAG TPA: BolA family protein [Kiloniellales bacterium]|nr:BolA family protein [Kiloniellales bacterium]